MKLGLSLGALAALQLLASFATQLVVFAALGAGPVTDSWVAAQTIPMILFSVASVAFTGVWQSRLAVDAATPTAWHTSQRVAHGQLLMVGLVASALLAATAGLWTAWIFPGFSAAQLADTTHMTRLLLIASVANCHAGLLTTALRARGQFIRAEAIATAGAATALAAMPLALRTAGIEGAAWLMLLRAVVVFGWQFHLAGWPWPSIPAAWRDTHQWRQLRPLLLGSSLYKCGPVIDRYWTSLAPAGGMTAFNFIQTGMGALASVLERALCMPAHPLLARMAASGDLAGMRRLYRQRVRQVAVLTLAAVILLVLLRPVWPVLMAPILKLPVDALQQTWWLCLVLMAYLLPAASGSVVMSSFYALGDTRTPVRVGSAGFVLSIGLKSIGFMLGGLLGLAIATSAHYVLNMSVLCWLLERRLRTAPAATSPPA